MLTLAERAWRGGGNCYFDGKGTLLWEDEPELLAAFKEFEDRLLWQKKTWLKEVPFPYVCQTQSEWQITDAFPNGGDLTKVFPPEQQEDSVYQYEGKTYQTRKIIGQRHLSAPCMGHAGSWLLCQSAGEPHRLRHPLDLFSKGKKGEAGAGVPELQPFWSDLAPRQGTWDYKCSRGMAQWSGNHASCMGEHEYRAF